MQYCLTGSAIGASSDAPAATIGKQANRLASLGWAVSSLVSDERARLFCLCMRCINARPAALQP